MDMSGSHRPHSQGDDRGFIGTIQTTMTIVIVVYTAHHTPPKAFVSDPASSAVYASTGKLATSAHWRLPSVTPLHEQDADAAAEQRKPLVLDGGSFTLPISNWQLCDVTDKDIRRLLDAEQGILPVCNERDGWYRPEVLAGVRKLCRLKRQAATNNTSASQEEVEAIIAETFSLLEREYTPPDASQAAEAAANEKNAASMARANEPAHEMDAKMNMLLQNLSQALASDAPEPSSSITATATVASRTLSQHHPQDYSGLFSDVDEFEGIFGDSLDEEDEEEEEEEEEED
ncbi:hypothetical protein SYNPS1DRAFT_30508 [Syncephalis pseudoplumigaleata]|uniref:Uncharacterized protein n=1 Tax=Syncephalis pseudoplumigaleata TaxID=1712513 RepID=A0A4P9YUS7_9FUNG|nr:hypothetical protein SYNPS1DRAFT_30508 [Syncephalis pseudoplumigaleata]|eukprot:RKP23737.1 hypothetical protein SYNPS1DRAFT_30508 [Syncephalis pseudoplumigaleata]